MGAKTIKKITCRSGWYLDGITIQFTDGSSTPWHEGYDGVELLNGEYINFPRNLLRLISEFLGEDITQVLVCSTDSLITKIKFITSKGKGCIQWIKQIS